MVAIVGLVGIFFCAGLTPVRGWDWSGWDLLLLVQWCVASKLSGCGIGTSSGMWTGWCSSAGSLKCLCPRGSCLLQTGYRDHRSCCLACFFDAIRPTFCPVPLGQPCTSMLVPCDRQGLMRPPCLATLLQVIRVACWSQSPPICAASLLLYPFRTHMPCYWYTLHKQGTSFLCAFGCVSSLFGRHQHRYLSGSIPALRLLTPVAAHIPHLADLMPQAVLMLGWWRWLRN